MSIINFMNKYDDGQGDQCNKMKKEENGEGKQQQQQQQRQSTKHVLITVLSV